LNAELVRQGHAVAACFPPNTRFCGDFADAQAAAIAARRGLWDFDPDDWPEPGRTDNVVEGVRVASVLDGDTIQLEDGTVVRYIGIDAPESEEVWKEDAFGHAAYAANKELVEGKAVTLEYDTEFSDPRGRELAYVYVDGEGDRTMVNAELVRRGQAWLAVFPPNIQHIKTLFEAQERAMKEGDGLWGMGD
jgi:micrococcal nuclease